jgi:hypothetical protein
MFGVGSGLSHKQYIMLKRLSKDKQYSVVQTFVNYGRKKYLTIGPRACMMKLFTSVINFIAE